MFSWIQRINLLLALLLTQRRTQGFSVGRRLSLRLQPDAILPSLQARRSNPEFSVVDEENDTESSQEEGSGGDFFQVTQNQSHQDSHPSQRPEYGALAAGTVVHVQIGDLALARKAWKKRRRTGSPLLVPCSILNVDRRSMVRWNLIFLLEKFGKSLSDGIEITASELSKRYRTFLKSSLQRQAEALFFDSSQEMIEELFNKKVQESYGVRLIEKQSGELALKAPMSRSKGQKRAANTPILQFRLPKAGDHGDQDTLTHTGYLRTRRPDQNADDKSYHFMPLSAALRVSQKDDVDTGRIQEGSIHAAVVFDYDLAGDGGSPLLTLSLNPRGIRDSLKIRPDRKFQPIENPKHKFNNLRVGDGPYRAKVVRLLGGRAIVDMEVGREISSGSMVKVMGTLRFQDSVEIDPSSIPNMMYDPDEDDTPYDMEGIADTIESALFDLDADDDLEDDEDSVADALLTLRAEDSFEEGTFEDGEEEEDISDLFEMQTDGSLKYTDPETGEVTLMDISDDDGDNEDVQQTDADDLEDLGDDSLDMSSLFETTEEGTIAFVDPDSGEILELDDEDDDYEDMVMIKSLIDTYSKPPMPDKVDYTHTEPSAQDKFEAESSPSLVSKRLRVGDEIQVFVRTISKQSSQFTVTTNPFVKGRKAKDLKKESDSNKKLARLKKSLGGSLQKIWDVEGHECNGVVKATSKTGEWYYVQPDLPDLPVGVARPAQDLEYDLSAGDAVRVRITGIDNERGQFAMKLLNKA